MSNCGDGPSNLRCSFCHASDGVSFVTGMDPGACICDRCVQICYNIIAEQRDGSKSGTASIADTSKTSCYYKAVCESEAAAIRAYHATDDVFERVPAVTSFGKKRTGNALFFRFDNSAETVARMVQALRDSGHFQEVSELSEELFWRSPSTGV
jgi:hypothetical protein